MRSKSFAVLFRNSTSVPNHSTFDKSGMKSALFALPFGPFAFNDCGIFSILSASFLAGDLRRIPCHCSAWVELCFPPSSC